jgi:hypothetical protein
MKNIRNTIILLIICAVPCAGFSPEIETVLKQAGNNRAELEKVLKRYGKTPADSLKLRAAEFLIANMPGKYAEYYDAPWNDVATALLRWTSSSNKQMVVDTYRLGKPVIKEDVKYITADYLINNIELAFKVWQEQPWGKHIPFDVFCEEILPYRLDVEPLENWREKALVSFADLNRSFKNDSTITAIEACSKVNDLLPRFRVDKDFPVMNYSQLMASTRGTCDAMAALAVFSMRALGIPVTLDFTQLWPNLGHGHSWNAVRDSAGRHLSFMGAESNPGVPHMGSVGTKNKVYRKTFSKRPLPMNDKYLPQFFRDNIIDVSGEYEGFYKVNIPVKYPPGGQAGYAYLAGKHFAQWIIVEWGVVDGDTIRYALVGKQVQYLPVWYAAGRLKPAGDVFALDKDGKIFSVSNEHKPFKGPHILSKAAPCIIPMRDFDMGGEGVAFHESDNYNSQIEGDDYRRSYGDMNSFPVDVDNGTLIAWSALGEWLLYTVEVRDAGEYQLSISVSTMLEPTFHLEVDGLNVSGPISVAPTGGWANWTWYPEKPLNVYLTAGTHQIKYYLESGENNLYEMKLEYVK